MKSKIPVYNLAGEKLSDVECDYAFLNVEPTGCVVHQVVVAQQNNARRAIAHAKGRAEVSGGGKKPWRQKGTGRARHGSSRSPIWVGGGVTFGPTKDRNFSEKVNKKMKQKAMFMCLTDKFVSEKMYLLDSLKIENHKTKDLIAFFDKLPSKGKKILVALDEKNVNFMRAVKNIKKIKAIGINSINVVDILGYDYFVTTKNGLEKITVIYKQLNLKKEKDSAKVVSKTDAKSEQKDIDNSLN